MRREFVLVLAMAMACGNAPAQSVFKCVAGNGAVSYQSAPCDAGSRQVQAWQAPPEPPPSAAMRRELAHKRHRDREESAFLSRRAGTDRSVARLVRPDVPSACEAAKAQRQRTLDAVGLKRSFDLLSRLDEQVRQACR